MQTLCKLISAEGALSRAILAVGFLEIVIRTLHGSIVARPEFSLFVQEDIGRFNVTIAPSVRMANIQSL